MNENELEKFIDKKVKIIFKHIKGVTDTDETRKITGVLKYGTFFEDCQKEFYIIENNRYIILNTYFIKKIKIVK